MGLQLKRAAIALIGLFVCYISYEKGSPISAEVDPLSDVSLIGTINQEISTNKETNKNAYLPPNCQDISVFLDSTGTVTIDSNAVDNGSTATAGIDSMFIDRMTFTCADVGPNPVLLSVVDSLGNVETCNATVTVVDSFGGSICASCRDITVFLDSTGSVSIDSNAVDNGSTAISGIDSFVTSQLNFDCSNHGENPVILSIFSLGDINTCRATVTVLDTIIPSCPDTIRVNLPPNGIIAANEVLATVPPAALDNCPVSRFAFGGVRNHTCARLNSPGGNNVNLRDPGGNQVTCFYIVVVSDVTPPVARCRNAVVYLDGSGSITVPPDIIDNGSTDACGIGLRSVSPSMFDCDSIGFRDVILTVQDSSGNEASCPSRIEIRDTTSTNISCRNIDAYLDSQGADTIALSDIVITTSDACGVERVFLNDSIFNCADIGTQMVVVTAIDSNNNSDTCQAIVTVLDTIPPVANCRDIEIYLDAAGTVSIAEDSINAGATDACSAFFLFDTDTTSFNCSDIGPNPVILTVSDASGNTDTCQSTVTVMDTVPPIAQCRNLTVYLDPAGLVTISEDSINARSTDACSTALIFDTDNTSFDCTELGENRVILTVFDSNNNFDTCSARVTVLDTVRPEAICRNLTVYTNAMGSVSISEDSVNNGSTDACSMLFLFDTDSTSFNCAQLGTNTVVLTVTDANNNSDTCAATVTVLDTTSPVASCQNVSVYLGANGVATIDSSALDNGSSDACGIATIRLDSSRFDCDDLGANQVVLTAIDISGNTDTCISIVTVIDSVAPIAFCKNDIVYLDNTGTGNIDPNELNNGSIEACDLMFLLDIDTTFDCTNVGPNAAILTVRDQSNNFDTCSVSITVLDTTPPVAICQDLTLYTNAVGTINISEDSVNNGSTDACGGMLLFDIDTTSFDCSDLGLNTVILTVTDQSNNSNSCAATVTVIDTVRPNAICKNDTVYLDNSGMGNLIPDSLNNGSSDACGIMGFSTDVSTFDCNSPTQNVTLTVTDSSGNFDTCISRIFVFDTITPTAICKDITVYLDPNGSINIAQDSVNNGSVGACAIERIETDIVNFNCDAIGVNTVVLSLIDADNFVLDTCQARVSVLDTVSPNALCQDTTVFLDVFGSANVTVSHIDNGSNDACGLDSLFISQSIFTCSDAGMNSITLTVIDSNGNMSSCLGMVNVLDTVCNDLVRLSLIDPCSCNNDQTTNGAQDGTFDERLAVLRTNITDTWTVRSIRSQATGGTIPAGILVNDTLVYNASANQHEIQFSHTDLSGYVIEVEGPGNLGAPGNVVFIDSNLCQYPVVAFSPIIDSALCNFASPIVLGAIDTNGNPGNAVFTIDGIIQSSLNPRDLSRGPHTLATRFTGILVDNMNGTEANPAYPGCLTNLDTSFLIIEAPVISLNRSLNTCRGRDIDLTSIGADIQLSGMVFTGNWSSSGTGTFSPNSTFSSALNYTPSAADIEQGNLQLTLTADDNGPCTGVADSIEIQILFVDCGSFPWRP